MTKSSVASSDEDGFSEWIYFLFGDEGHFAPEVVGNFTGDVHEAQVTQRGDDGIFERRQQV